MKEKQGISPWNKADTRFRKEEKTRTGEDTSDGKYLGQEI